MGFAKYISAFVLVCAVALVPTGFAWGEQVAIKCHITCRCLQDNTVGNFAFVIPVERSPDVGFDADQACNAYGHRVCSDGCNGLKFNYTYQIVSP